MFLRWVDGKAQVADALTELLGNGDLLRVVCPQASILETVSFCGSLRKGSSGLHTHPSSASFLVHECERERQTLTTRDGSDSISS